MISIKNLSKSYNKNLILKNLNLDINDGEFIVVLGPSGCGKSTLLNLISGLLDADSGQIYFGNQDVTRFTPKERNVSMVFQDYALFPDMNVYQNIAFGLQIRKYKKFDIDRIVNDIAQKLQIADLLKRKPKELSGGEQQRVAIARAMVKNPTVYLFDEPLSNLDVNLKSEFMELIKELHNETKSTFIYVTHAQNEALSLADRIVVMNAGEIIQVSTPIELYKNPANLFVARFIGDPKINIINLDNHYMLGIRPEQIRLGIDDSKNIISLNGIIKDVEFLGNGYILNVSIDNMVIKVFSLSFFNPKDTIIVSFCLDDSVLFDTAGKRVGINNKIIRVLSNKIIMEEK